MLKHKDYQGSVSFSDGRLVIKILHIEDTITDECDSASEAQAKFEALVEDYIETCEAVGKEPSKPFKGSFNVRVSPSLHRRAVMAAAEGGESLNSWVEAAMERHLATKRPILTLDEVRNLFAQKNLVRSQSGINVVEVTPQSPHRVPLLSEGMSLASMGLKIAATTSRGRWNG